jgi:hypothetical protein
MHVRSTIARHRDSLILPPKAVAPQRSQPLFPPCHPNCYGRPAAHQRAHPRACPPPAVQRGGKETETVEEERQLSWVLPLKNSCPARGANVGTVGLVRIYYWWTAVAGKCLLSSRSGAATAAATGRRGGGVRCWCVAAVDSKGGGGGGDGDGCQYPSLIFFS